MTSAIEFFFEDIDFALDEPELLRNWITNLVLKYKHRIQQIDYIFCSDDYLLKINQDYLKHDDFTDIITFPYHPEGSKDLHADLYISVERVKENALQLGQSFVDELHRVMAHGVLHMVGFKDKDEKSAGEMRRAEDFALSLRMF
jgi:probable rRNA maturation factor